MRKTIPAIMQGTPSSPAICYMSMTKTEYSLIKNDAVEIMAEAGLRQLFSRYPILAYPANQRRYRAMLQQAIESWFETHHTHECHPARRRQPDDVP